MAKEKYLIMRDRESMLSPVYWNMVYQTSPIIKKIYKVNIPICWYLFKFDRVKAIFIKDDWHKTGNYIAKKMLNNSRYFKNLENKVKQETKKLDIFFQKAKSFDFTVLSFNELVDLANKIQKLCLDYEAANVLAWFVGGDQFQKIVSELIDIPQNDFLFLTTPREKTKVSKFEYDLLICAQLIKTGKRNLENAAKKLSNDYSWIPFSYDGPEYWDKEYFVNKLKKDIKNYSKKVEQEIGLTEKADKDNLVRRKKIINNLKLNKKQQELINRINTLALWTDGRKKYTFKLYYYYSQVLIEIEKRYNIPYKNLKYLLTEELFKVANSKDEVIKITNQRINNEFVVEAKNGKVSIISNKQKDKILKELKGQTKQSNIKGMVASRGMKSIYQGKVKVLFSPKEGNKIKKGDFLVATMTSPDYIVSMKKAAGFITDEGGITCHAAIVAREMNKPCIIGTKIVTKVLKDGDLVEVDADKGIVKIIKRAEQQG